MYLAHRPSPRDIERFVDRSRDLPLSYTPVGIVRERPANRRFDEQAVMVGHGEVDFERAHDALMAWRHFDLGWVQLVPPRASIEVGTVVAVVIRHVGFWSLNGARVVYHVGGEARFGFAYGTLTNHAESGEELFEVFVDPATGNVVYRIRAISRPQTALAFIGQAIVRVLQARFRRDSAVMMIRAVRAT